MEVEFKSENNTELVGEFYETENPKALILINPAAAVKTSYYRHVIKYLNNENYNVFVWNYCCFTGSESKDLKKSKFRYSDIGHYDVPAAISKAKELCPKLPLFCLGHSVGAQQLAFTDKHNYIDGLIAVASSAGHIPSMPFGYGIQAFFFFNIFTPITHKIFDYVPASKFNIMEDLPTTFVKEWGDLCKETDLIFSPKYYGHSVPSGTYKNVDFPIKVMASDDDEISTSKNIKNFWKHVSSKRGLEFHTYQSKDFPRKKIGHFGYFKKGQDVIWKDIVLCFNQWLEADS